MMMELQNEMQFSIIVLF